MKLDQALSLLKEGKPVAFPTETVYGLGASLYSKEGIEAIYALKGRPRDNPLIVHVATFEQAALVVESLPESLLRHFWPGPLTVVLPKKKCVPDTVSGGLPTVGLRMPAHPVALALIEEAGPLVAPSANLSGCPSATTAEHVREDFGDEVFVIDGGPCLEGLESTVLSLNPPTILRPGTITQNQLETVLGDKIHFAKGKVERPLSPGMKYKHYAPKAKLRLVEANERVAPAPNRLILHSLRPDELYARFREADRLGFEEIIVCCDQSIKSNAALMNRLIRASS